MPPGVEYTILYSTYCTLPLSPGICGRSHLYGTDVIPPRVQYHSVLYHTTIPRDLRTESLGACLEDLDLHSRFPQYCIAYAPSLNPPWYALRFPRDLRTESLGACLEALDLERRVPLECIPSMDSEELQMVSKEWVKLAHIVVSTRQYSTG